MENKYSDKISNWWNMNINDGFVDSFKIWVGNYDALTKVATRKHIIENNYKSILDVGCGLCDTYYGYKNDNYDIEYTGVDSCDFFVNKAKEQGINVIKSDVQHIKVDDKSYDVVYGRHIIEHLPCFQIALKEFIRIAKKEVIIVFFQKPNENLEEIKYTSHDDLYHNKYSRKDINDFVKENNCDIEWINISDHEEISYIKINN